ncbi:integrase [Pandoraea sputorum]|uniref:Integrase n=1 Tax=Pandoraea sputorum TaxID=93222 RepID=A0A5E5BIL1_9BURK|nr:integrase [Pandoraea sputorum]
MKHEHVYLESYANMAELLIGLSEYFAFYNTERPHQPLAYRTPDEVYGSGCGAGAIIVDKYGAA